MKTICIILCNAAVALGIVVGRMDYEAEKKSARAEAALRAQADAQGASLQAPPLSPKSARRTRSQETVRDDFIVGMGDKPSDTTSLEPSSVAPNREQVPDASRLRARLEKLTDTLRRHDFTAAEAEARALASETERGPISVHDKAVQMAAKARAFEKIIAQLPQGDAAAPARVAAKVSEVLLANGNKVIALKADEEGDRYVFKLQSGAIYTPRKEDVLAVRTIEKEISVAPGWPELEQKLSKLDDSILLFVDGVQKCYRMGLRKEGLDVLERILARSDSDQIPLLFVPNADDALLHDWQIAAGRKAASSETASAAEASVAKNEATTARRPEAFDSTSSASDASTRAPAVVDAASMAKASQLFGQAQALYQASVGKEGRESDLKTARERLEKALELVESMPRGDTEVTKLRRQLAQLLSDVARASPF